MVSPQKQAKLEEAKQQKNAKKVIEPCVPHDAEERVTRAFKQWNLVIREHIRNETGLRLSDGDGRNSIQVKVIDGFPISLAKLINNHDDPLLWKLIVGQRKLGGMVEGVNFLLDDWDQFESWEKLPSVAEDGGVHLERVGEIGDALQKLAIADTVRKQIKEIREDILGVYKFGKSMASRVEIYWMPIAMVAAMLDVRIEDLTIVVLAHELSHGYTHIGRDIDGRQWSDEGFAKSDLALVEGLAQFYTEVVTKQLSSRLPGPHVAYEKLLELQSAPYREQLSWQQGERSQKGEIIRFSMIAARNEGKMAICDWRDLLEKTSSNLARRTNRSREIEITTAASETPISHL